MFIVIMFKADSLFSEDGSSIHSETHSLREAILKEHEEMVTLARTFLLWNFLPCYYTLKITVSKVQFEVWFRLFHWIVCCDLGSGHCRLSATFTHITEVILKSFTLKNEVCLKYYSSDLEVKVLVDFFRIGTMGLWSIIPCWNSFY